LGKLTYKSYQMYENKYISVAFVHLSNMKLPLNDIFGNPKIMGF